jgi:hypothetical protein
MDSSTFPPGVAMQMNDILTGLKTYADRTLYMPERRELFRKTRSLRRKLHTQLERAFDAEPALAKELGIDARRTFEVHDLRRATRTTSDGRQVPQLIISLTQSEEHEADPATGRPRFTFRGGSTFIIDLAVPEVKYRIFKNLDSVDRRARTASFFRDVAADPLRALFFASGAGEPFAALHALVEDEGV